MACVELTGYSKLVFSPKFNFSSIGAEAMVESKVAKSAPRPYVPFLKVGGVVGGFTAPVRIPRKEIHVDFGVEAVAPSAAPSRRNASVRPAWEVSALPVLSRFPPL